MDTEDTGHWLPRAEAALALGLHERTVRRRIAAGRCRARHQGQAVEVWRHSALNTGQDNGRVADGHDRGSPATAQGDLTQLLREQIEGRLRADQAATMWQERARNLEVQVEQLLALPAHQEPEPHWRWWQAWWRGPQPRQP